MHLGAFISVFLEGFGCTWGHLFLYFWKALGAPGGIYFWKALGAPGGIYFCISGRLWVHLGAFISVFLEGFECIWGHLFLEGFEFSAPMGIWAFISVFLQVSEKCIIWVAWDLGQGDRCL